MKIVSVSMKEDLYKELERLQKEMNFKGRSEIVRHGINSLREESKSMENLKGHLDCILLLMHSKAESGIEKLMHKNEDLIKTQIHNNICNDKCLETFILHGNSEKIKSLYNEVRKNKKIDYIKLIVP